MADYQTELSQSGNTLYLKPADGFERSTVFGLAGSDTHHFTGSMYVSGTLYANEYRVNQIDILSGSTIFGNSSDDTHQFTGSAYMANDLYVVGTIFGGSPVKIGGGMSVSGTLDMSGSTSFGSHVSHNHTFTGSILQTGSGGTNRFRDSNVFGQLANHSHTISGSLRISGSTYIEDDHRIYFGTDNNVSIRYDEAGENVLRIDNDTLIDNDKKLYFGNDKNFSLKWHSSNEYLAIDNNIQLADDKIIYFGGSGDGSIHYDEDGTDSFTILGSNTKIISKTPGLFGSNTPIQLTASQINIGDDTKLYFGANNDAHIEYDENGTDHFRVVAANTTFDLGGSNALVVSGSTTVVGNLTTNNGNLKVETGGFGNTSAILTGSLTLDNGGITLKDEQGITLGEGSIVVDSASAPYSMVISPEDGVNFTQQAKASNKLIVSAKNNHTASVAFEVHYTGSHDPTTLANNTGGGEVVYFGSGSTTQGALHYLNDAGGWSTTNASATGSVHGGSGGGNESLLGIALGTNPNVDGMLINGFFDADTYFTGTWTAGKAVYMYAGTGGKMTATAPAASSNFVRIVGYATDTAKVIYLNPDSSWVVID